MKQVKYAGGQGFATGRNEQDHGFDIPQTEEVSDIPNPGQSFGNLRPFHMPKPLPAGSAFDLSSLPQIPIQGAAGSHGSLPAEDDVTSKECQDNDRKALVKQVQP